MPGGGGEKGGDRISIQHRKLGLIVNEMEDDDIDLSILGQSYAGSRPIKISLFPPQTF